MGVVYVWSHGMAHLSLMANRPRTILSLTLTTKSLYCAGDKLYIGIETDNFYVPVKFQTNLTAPRFILYFGFAAGRILQELANSGLCDNLDNLIQISQKIS